MRDLYLAAPDFEAMLASATKNVELWGAVWRRASVPDSFVERIGALGGAWHLLVLSADWCGDAVNAVPVIARLAELSANADLRVVERDEHPDIMRTHLTSSSRSIPVVIALDEQYVERGWWGPRPSELQQWVLGEGKLLEKSERYREIRTWYARDRGLTTLEEVVSMMERGHRQVAGALG
jgi:thiol-disulfide isomerase/thioredoxin